MAGGDHLYNINETNPTFFLLLYTIKETLSNTTPLSPDIYPSVSGTLNIRYVTGKSSTPDVKILWPDVIVRRTEAFDKAVQKA